jgi:uncharacterized membrane protein YgaE (UPF0421/DUF939 family)
VEVKYGSPNRHFTTFTRVVLGFFINFILFPIRLEINLLL